MTTTKKIEDDNRTREDSEGVTNQWTSRGEHIEKCIYNIIWTQIQESETTL